MIVLKTIGPALFFWLMHSHYLFQDSDQRHDLAKKAIVCKQDFLTMLPQELIITIVGFLYSQDNRSFLYSYNALRQSSKRLCTLLSDNQVKKRFSIELLKHVVSNDKKKRLEQVIDGIMLLESNEQDNLHESPRYLAWCEKSSLW